MRLGRRLAVGVVEDTEREVQPVPATAPRRETSEVVVRSEEPTRHEELAGRSVDR